MIYLVGFSIVNGVSKKKVRFKRLRIPFQTKREFEKFRIEWQNDINPDIDLTRLRDGDNFKVKWLDLIWVDNKGAELSKR